MKIWFFDRWIYKLFYWRWNRILAHHPVMREAMISHLKAFDSLDNGEQVKVTVTIEKL